MSAVPFSFHELQEATKVAIADTSTLTASDGVKLAYRCYVPSIPRATLLFYHGGGAHSSAGYQYLGNGLQSQFHTAVYLPDIRGHGASEGPRGDTSHPQQVWQDITTFIQYVRAQHPDIALFLGGHSSGAGVVLNYISQANHEDVDGYIFLSPQLGFRSKTERPSLAAPFAMVNVLAFIINALSGGRLGGHTHAVRFNYPAEVLATDKSLVTSNTVHMANAITPAAPHQQFAKLDRPFGLWIGSEDELMLPGNVLAFADLAVAVRSLSEAESIPGARHLSILLEAHETIGPWIDHRVKSTQRERNTNLAPYRQRYKQDA